MILKIRTSHAANTDLIISGSNKTNSPVSYEELVQQAEAIVYALSRTLPATTFSEISNLFIEAKQLKKNTSESERYLNKLHKSYKKLEVR